ncbi:hypothetical protein J1N35_033077 [Gossypium stocksii]|uniref:Uncharacterized protein n=1 Tax=Gossypium stocksii TaxID=47602 RepID=A0A9D3ZP45_9ROSI|nr:hypothetical protein J1N35_033077 [Gossypium stocksii]
MCESMEDDLTGSDWQGPNGGAIWLLVASPLCLGSMIPSGYKMKHLLYEVIVLGILYVKLIASVKKPRPALVNITIASGTQIHHNSSEGGNLSLAEKRKPTLSPKRPPL